MDFWIAFGAILVYWFFGYWSSASTARWESINLPELHSRSSRKIELAIAAIFLGIFSFGLNALVGNLGLDRNRYFLNPIWSWPTK